MNCDTCGAEIDPETDRHVHRSERVVAPDLGTEATDGGTLCADCGDVADARLAPR